MLELMRKNVGGLLGITLVGALVLAFSLSFGEQSAGWDKGTSDQDVAVVDGNPISEASFNFGLALTGANRLSANDPEYMGSRKAVADGLVERQILLSLASEAGIWASLEEAEDKILAGEMYFSVPVETIAERFKGNPYLDAATVCAQMLDGGYRIRERFEKDGKFDFEIFDGWVKNRLRMTNENFVEEQRLELVAQRMRKILVNGVQLSEAEVRNIYDRDNDNASISYIRLFPSYYADKLDPTPEEMQEWIDANGDAIKQYYETNKYKYTNLEKMARARHILLKVAEDATEEEKATAKTEIDGLLARVNAGEDFAELAKQYSEDPGSGTKGGDLGFNPKGRMVPEFDEVMFNLEPGQVSEVVETKFGFHIIKLVGFREGNIDLEEAQGEIADQLYREDEGKKRAKAAADGFLARLKAGEDINSLIPKLEGDEAAKDHLGLKVRSTPPFSRNEATIPGIGNAPEIASAAFALTKEAPAADEVFEVRDDLFVVALKERVIPNDDDFNKQKDGLYEELLVQKRATWLREYLNQIRQDWEKSGRIEVVFSAKAGEAASADQDIALPSEGSEKDDGEKADKPAEADDETAKKPQEEPSEDDAKDEEDDVE